MKYIHYLYIYIHPPTPAKQGGARQGIGGSNSTRQQQLRNNSTGTLGANVINIWGPLWQNAMCYKLRRYEKHIILCSAPARTRRAHEQHQRSHYYTVHNPYGIGIAGVRSSTIQ